MVVLLLIAYAFLPPRIYRTGLHSSRSILFENCIHAERFNLGSRWEINEYPIENNYRHNYRLISYFGVSSATLDLFSFLFVIILWSSEKSYLLGNSVEPFQLHGYSDANVSWLDKTHRYASLHSLPLRTLHPRIESQ
jgi:hypothetical protein